VSFGKLLFRQPWRWSGVLLVAALAALAWLQPPTGRQYASLAQFLGRFHPILVHVPIGLIVLVPVLELAGAFGRRDDLRNAAGFVLNFAAAATIISALDGWFLAHHGGYSGPLVIRHMWCGVALSALCLVAAWVRRAFSADFQKWPGFLFIYGPLLVATVVLMAWTGHQGGQLTHGETFLTDHMPRRLRVWLRIPIPINPAPLEEGAPTGEPTVYGTRIAPIFKRSCISCHGEKKVKGGFRLDTYAWLMRGGENGAEVVPWHPQKSELYRRITLPPDDDDSMPGNGKNPPSADEIKLIEQWIAAGASNTQPLNQ